MKDLLAVIAKGLVDDPDSVSVEADAPNEEGTVVYHIHVAENDMGRIIGKQNCQGYPHNCPQCRYPQ